MAPNPPFWRALFAAAAILVAGCSKEPTTAAEPSVSAFAPTFATAPQTAGAELCMDCHEELVQSYAKSAMARAMGPVSKAELEPLASLAAVPSASGFHYGIFPTPGGDAFVVGETSAQHPGYARGTELLFGIGAGVRDRSLVVQHGTNMYFAPLEVLNLEDGRQTALSPAEMIAPGQRFSFPISPECLGCHTDALPKLTYPLNLAPPNFEPRGISCAGCHGTPGNLLSHVTFQEADLAGEAPLGSDPILHLAELDRPKRMSICAACHLQGDARIELQNATLGTFAAGSDITEARAVFVGRHATDEVGFVSQTERLALSVCFQNSDLDCTTCHNPHEALAASEREINSTRAACNQCHATSDTSATHCARTPAATDGDCVSCHMPETGVFDVAAVTIHDHFIRARPGPSTATNTWRFAESPTGDWRRFAWPGEPAPSTADDLGLWMMAYAGGGLIEKAQELVDADPGAGARDLAMYHHVRASLLDGMGRQEDAAAEYEIALALDPALAISATNLGLLQAQLGRPDKGLTLLNNLIERYPLASGALRNRALVRRQMGDDAGFLQDLERAFQLEPSAQLAARLADSFRAKTEAQDPQKAQRYAELAQQLDPR